jgi:hypothetical protein
MKFPDMPGLVGKFHNRAHYIDIVGAVFNN